MGAGKRALWSILLALAAFYGAAGCVRPQFEVTQSPKELKRFSKIYIADVIVTSKEDNEDAEELNERFRELAKYQLSTKLQEFSRFELVSTPGSGPGTLILETKVDIVYGNRALRYLVGFGAGSGNCNSTAVFKDAETGQVVFSLQNKSDIDDGRSGGDMETLVTNNLRGLANELVNRI